MPGFDRHNRDVARRSLLAIPSIEVHGHRGARGLFPENSIPGFKYAIRAGVDFIELDVQVTADNVPVVWHDPVLTRRKFRGPRRRAAVRDLMRIPVDADRCSGMMAITIPG